MNSYVKLKKKIINRKLYIYKEKIILKIYHDTV